MRRLATVGLVLLLAGCGSTSPKDELAALVDEATVAANARDADGLRDAAQSLADTASAQRDAGSLPEATAEELIALAGRLRTSADLVDPEVKARQAAEARAREAAAQAEAAEKARAEAEARAEEAAARAAAERARSQDEDDEGGRGKGKGKDDEGKDDD